MGQESKDEEGGGRGGGRGEGNKGGVFIETTGYGYS